MSSYHMGNPGGVATWQARGPPMAGLATNSE